MPRKSTRPSKPVKLILKRRGGKRREKHASLACYGYQKIVLKRRASDHNCSVSYYLNMMLWRDWL